MSDERVYRWYRPVRAPMSFESYERLPRHPSKKPDLLAGALLITLLVGEERSWYAELRAAVSPPPPDLADGREQAQISWIFVRPGAARRGVGSAMLAATVRALWGAGHRELASATHCGNESSLTWHRRNGFRLLPQSDSIRLPGLWDGDRSNLKNHPSLLLARSRQNRPNLFPEPAVESKRARG
jgi:GNAT superfamily N-acetyltransferase